MEVLQSLLTCTSNKQNSDQCNSLVQKLLDTICNKLNSTADEKGLLSQQLLSAEEITKLAIAVLNIADPEAKLKDPAMGLYHELEIFDSNDKTVDAPKTYFSRICGCSSISGTLYFKDILMNYTDNLEVLHRRQSNLHFFQSLSHDKYNYLNTVLSEFSKNEPVYYWNISKKTPEMKQVLDMLFFNKSWTKFLNEKEGFLGMYYYFIILITPIWGIVSPFIFFFVPYLVAKYIIKLPIPFDFYVKQMKDMLFGKQFFAMVGVIQKVFESFYMGPNNEETMKTKLISKLFDILQTNIARWVYLGFIVASYFYGIYNYILGSMNYNKLLNFIHERLNHVRQLIDTAVICLSVLEPQRSRCHELDTISKECYALLNDNDTIAYLRNNDIFTKSPGLLRNKGCIVKVYYILEQLDRKALLAPFIKLFAWMDTWMSAAQLLNSKEPVCVVDWAVSSDMPVLNIENCWSPVGGKVKNSIDLQFTESPPVITVEPSATETPVATENPVAEPSATETPVVEPETETPVAEPETETPVAEPETETPIVEASATETPAPTKANCLLTGPNGSGKSTFLKAIMSSVIMAQTFGICPASTCKITPFKYLSTYLNIPDCQGRESLFQAEMRRCHDHLNMLKTLESKRQFSFNIMDEIFVSTNYLEGISGAYGVIKSLEQYPCSINIITTHFDKLTTMSLPQFCYKYFTIEKETNPETNEPIFKKDYKLRDGINDKHMALQLLKMRGFDDNLIKNANELYSMLTEGPENNEKTEKKQHKRK